MDLKKVVQDEVLPALELALKKYEGNLDAKVDQALDLLIAKIKEAIPGKFDDGLLDAAAPKIKEEVKKELDLLINNISGAV